jgi:NAD(P)-dependent dehydrogenase (short-subunit alcohol dehydrogenase family)
MSETFKSALIVGAGSGLSAALARSFAKDGIKVALAARTPGDLDGLVKETGAKAYTCDASQQGDVEKLFADLDRDFGAPEIVVYNASYRIRGPFADLDPDGVAKTLAITTYGAFLVAQQGVKRMLPNGRGVVLLTGASAGVKGYAESAPFAMGKFALRGMAQSMARELHPKGIHVAHIVVDGGIRSEKRVIPSDKPDSLLDPADIAESYMHLIHQPRNAWSWEIEVRPWVEKF